MVIFENTKFINGNNFGLVKVVLKVQTFIPINVTDVSNFIRRFVM